MVMVEGFEGFGAFGRPSQESSFVDPHPASVPKILRQGRLPAGRALLRADMVLSCIVMLCQDQELICAVKIDLSTHSLTAHSIFDSSAHSKCTIRSGVGGGLPITSQKSACTNELKNACTNEVLIYCLLSSLHQWDGSWDETMGKI